MQSIHNAMQTQFWAVRDYLAPVLKDSKFKEHGRITPEEFVAAGDFLVYKFPTWQWESGDKSKIRDFLPPDKQYLSQRNVPCIRRVSQMQNYAGDDDDKETLMTFKADELIGDDSPEDEWVATHTGSKARESGIDSAGHIPDIEETGAAESSLSNKLSNMSVQGGQQDQPAVPELDDIPDIEDDDLGGAGVEEPEDEAAAAPSAVTTTKPESTSNTLSVRTYDCFITYDKYYQVPRMWLSGLSPARQPLTTAEIFQDISVDYAQKTVTIEPFPNKENVSMASVHPCKHANVMKKVIERMNGAVKEQQRRQQAIDRGESPASPELGAAGGTKKKKGWGLSGAVKKVTGSGSSSSAAAATSAGKEDEVEGLRVDQYLLVFLKFMSNVVPTIELDATTSL